ncbi:MAG: KH domain-containing protein [Coriobacteriia bacterium]|nr:KH domain-containing protein [Coriobacteriia bacterium]MCL2537129.1 KH domain-containing protein [Coriobacteriia bacterium]
MKEYTATADTIEEAKALALENIGADPKDVHLEVLEEPGKKLFGGRKEAVVRASIKPEGESLEAPTVDEEEIIVEEVLVVDPGRDDLTIESEPASESEQNSRPAGDIVDAEDLSDEQVDAIADAGIEHLRALIAFLSDNEIKIEEFEGDEGEIILDVTGEDVGVLIGRHGRTIDALQSVVAAMTTKKTGVRYPLSVDVEGYKHRRKQKVVDIARRAAERARRTNRPVSLKAMTPHERRIVHMTLRNEQGISSTSEGSGSYRHVVVVPN